MVYPGRDSHGLLLMHPFAMLAYMPGPHILTSPGISPSEPAWMPRQSRSSMNP